MTSRRHLSLVPDTPPPLPNPAITVTCPHCGAQPNHPCGYATARRGWQTLVLRRYHPSREDLGQTQSAVGKDKP